MPKPIESTRKVIHVASNSHASCHICGNPAPGLGTESDFQREVNHYLAAHGLTLLHVGSETLTGDDGRPVPYTVAVLGQA